MADSLVIPEAVTDRRLQVGQRVEQSVVRRPPPPLLPEPLDRVQLRVVTGQAVEPQVRVLGQRVRDRLPPVPGGVVDHHDDFGMAVARVGPAEVPQVVGIRDLQASGLAPAGGPLRPRRTFQGVGGERRGGEVDGREGVQQVLAVAGADRRPVPFDAQGGGQGGDPREAGFVPAQDDEVPGRCSFPRRASSSRACRGACGAAGRRGRRRRRR
jgi:hypothetical protein